MKYKIAILGITSALIAALMLTAHPVYAQGDGRVDYQPGDRVVVYCNADSIGVLGIDNDGVGRPLGNFSYNDLTAASPGRIVRSTDYGIVSAGIDSPGVYRVAWLYEPDDDSEFIDVVKRFRCPAKAAPNYGSKAGHAPYGSTTITASASASGASASASVTITKSGRITIHLSVR